ncbi:MAG: DNA polymerase I [Bacilli bacterium]
MKKITLIDGNSLMFRSFYATAYTGNLMQNKKGLYTNAVFGFVNMISKILSNDVDYIFVAFDAGKQTFRHQSYDDYKGGRKKLPDELLVQIPYVKKYLDLLGIKRKETLDFEADDLIASVAQKASNAGFKVEVISGDQDLLQLVDENITVYMTKSGVKELEEYNISNFKEKRNYLPCQVIDYKGLVGDSSDNLPGIKGVGTKTACTLLEKYQTIENIYDHIDELKGKTKILFEENKDMALKCKYLATLVRNVPLDFDIEDLKYEELYSEELIDFYKELEFETFLKRIEKKRVNQIASDDSNIVVIDEEEELNLKGKSSISVEVFLSNYYNGEVLGLGLVNNNKNYFFTKKGLHNSNLKRYLESDEEKIVFDLKKTYVALKREGITLKGVSFDMLLASYLINPNYASDDFKTVANNFCVNDLPYTEDIYGANTKACIPEQQKYINYAINKANTIVSLQEELLKEIKEIELEKLLELEMNLSYTLGDMELSGLKISIRELDDIGVDLQIKVEDIADEIFMIAGMEFNINSPKQLGEILFEKLHLPHGKKNKTGYATGVEVLEKLAEDFDIAKKVLEYRAYTKIINTYVKGLKEVSDKHQMLHPLYKQALTTTGRLSSVEPNIQNIPVRTEVGQTIRKVFVSRFDGGEIVASDYSQIELRVLAHMSGDEAMIEAFNSGVDFHSKTASEMYEVPIEKVTSQMRRTAKAINFGIIYGMSAWGLSESLKITPKEANMYIERYFATYSKAKAFLDHLIEDCRSCGYSKTIMNRRRYIEEINSENANMRAFGERTSMNAPIQGSAADIIKLAMVAVDKKIKELNLKSLMIAQVHDELVFDCPSDEVDIIKKIVKETMESVIALKVPLICEANSGANWYEAK